MAVSQAAGCTARIVHVPTDFIVQCNPELVGGLWGDKANSVIFDNAKIRRLVPGFRATIPYAEGIRKTLAWFHADPARQVVRKETHAMLDRIVELYGH